MSDLIDIFMPKDQKEGTISRVSHWLKAPGDPVEIHEGLIEIETDKVSIEIPAPVSGVLKEVLATDNQTVDPGQLLGRIAIKQELSANQELSASQELPASINGTSQQPGPVQSKQPVKSSADNSAVLSPAVRRALSQYNLNIEKIRGTGKGARITFRDVTAYLAATSQSTAKSDTTLSSYTEPHSPMRSRIAEHMVESLLHTAPHVTSIFTVDLTAVMAHRKLPKQDDSKQGIKLTLTAYFVAAVVKALKKIPQVNSRYHKDHLEIISNLNIGIATALGHQGLVVPVIKNAQNLDLNSIAAKLQQLTEKARNRSLQTADLQHGTFTISNHGVSGSLVATPIVINQPQTAILGVGKVEQRVVVVEHNNQSSIAIKPMAYVTLTIDHRALDGFQANQFLSTFVSCLENWQ